MATLKKIDKNCTGWKEVYLMRRMRNAFAKTRLNYRTEDSDNIRLREEVIEHFKLEEPFGADEIPTPIDKVVGKIFKECRDYIQIKMQQYPSSPNNF